MVATKAHRWARQVCRCRPWCGLLPSPSVHTLVATPIPTPHLWSHGDGSLPPASTPTVPQQGEAGVQVPALVRPPAEPLCVHPGGHPTPQHRTSGRTGRPASPHPNVRGAAAGQGGRAGAGPGAAPCRAPLCAPRQPPRPQHSTSGCTGAARCPPPWRPWRRSRARRACRCQPRRGLVPGSSVCTAGGHGASATGEGVAQPRDKRPRRRRLTCGV